MGIGARNLISGASKFSNTDETKEKKTTFNLKVYLLLVIKFAWAILLSLAASIQ